MTRSDVQYADGVIQEALHGDAADVEMGCPCLFGPAGTAGIDSPSAPHSPSLLDTDLPATGLQL